MLTARREGRNTMSQDNRYPASSDGSELIMLARARVWQH
jgi:hypothetical protein